MKWFYCLLVLVSVNSECDGAPENITSPCIDKNHIFLAPGVLTAGGSSRACISRFHAEGSARLTITLLTEDREAVTASRELPPGDGGCIDITVPQLPNTKADMIVSVRYPDAQCTWERRATLRVSHARVVAAHTERARYRPGDTLRARLFVLKADLTPSAHGVIDEIWLEGPRAEWRGARAAQWARVRTRLGVAQVTHELDAHAPPGKWTLRAALGDGSQGSAVFWVGNYELPPFQLSVRHDARVLRTSERLVWTVCVRYPWTAAVEGMLVIRIRGAGTLTSDGTNGIRTAVWLRAPVACHRHAAAAKRIGLESRNPPDVVLADFSFQEKGTRIWQNTTVVSQVVDMAVTLEFLTKHRAVISPGLPYKLKVKAIRWDEKPAPNQLIRVCRSPASHESELQKPTSKTATLTHGACGDAITDVKGVARVMFSANDDGSAFYRFQATLQNDTSTTTAPLYLSVERSGSVHAALGPLKPELFAVRTFVPLYLSMRNISKAITVHFAVITRGGIIYKWGATTQCPFTNSANQIETAPRNSTCNGNLGKLDANTGKLDVNPSDALVGRHLLRVMLPIKITHQMCPDSHLIAYFYYMGELVSASKYFEIDECFGNKVEAVWQSRKTPPGSSIDLHISTPGPALCALTALDSASKWVQPGQSVKDIILERLRRLIDGRRNLTEYDAAGECFLTADTPDPPTTSMELTAAWMAAAGVRILGGEAIRSRRCRSSAPAPLLADEVTVPRSDFSEAWLWRIVAVGASNRSTVTGTRAPDSITSYEASAVCVSRTGLAISQPAVLQVFREFFVHADSPKRLRRGDTTIVIYRLFNNLHEPLSVQIQILTDPHLEGPSDSVHTACVSPLSSIARRIEVRARLPGNARINIRAKSVRDGRCGNVTHSRSEVSDEVIIQITVDPEGVPVQDQKSILLCGRGSTESSTSGVSWSWPEVEAVPGTEALTVWAIGDIAGPLLADADDLVTLPRGCGEQNMARLATNLLALKQLDPRSTAANAAKEHVARGFTRQLQYLHPSGGFSAFGSSDAAPSTWLTAFAVRYLRRAHEILTPGSPAPPALEQAEHWLLNQQMENGCFRNEGQVFHRELRGGLNEDGEIASVALTAYVITSLIESSIPIPSRILRNTLSCLRALPPLKTRNPAKVYAHSLLAYTLMRLRNYEEEVKRVNEASLLDRRGDWKDVRGLEQDEEMRELVELLKMARRTGEYVWWETGSLSTSIEATGYALLALSRCPLTLRNSSCAHDALGAIRWLSTHRNAAGGFVATQDTLVALEALISWSSVQPSTPTRLIVTAQSSDTKRSVSIQSGGRIPDVMKMGDATKLSVNVEGTGCALIQATRFYNAHFSDDSRDKLLSVQVTVHTDGTYNCDLNATSCFCAAVVEACVVWTGAFPEMALLEVALPGGFGADASLLYSQLQQNSTLVRRIELTPNSGRATLYLGTRDGSDTLDRGGHECYNLHAVGPRTKTKAAYAKVMDYYRPMVNDTQLYTIPEDCPPRISHETNQYLASENLFNKVKSLSDSKDIIITHEFSFEDIPDGIPLEDPLYDNLKDEKEANVYEINETEAKTNITNDKIDVKYTILPLIPVKVTKLDDKLAKIDDDTTQGDVMNSISEHPDAVDKDLSKTQEQTDRRESNSSDLVNVKDNTTIKDKIIKSSINQERKEPNSSDSIIHLTVHESTTNKINANSSVREGKSYFNYLNNQNEEVIDKTTTDIQNETPITYVQKEQLNETRNEIQKPVQATTMTNQEEKASNVIKDLKDVNAQDKEVGNPNLAHFHVIDSEKDLEVPAGIEGPVPSVVLPPPEMTRRSYFDDPNTGINYGVPLNRMQYQNPRTFDSRPGVYFYYNQPIDNVYLWNNIRRYGR